MTFRLARSLAISLVVLSVLSPARPVLAQGIDHFTCYKVTRTGGTTDFVAMPGVSLVDQFRASTVEVKKPMLLCAPTSKLGEDPSAPSHPPHLGDYQIKPTVPFTPVVNQAVVDQFGTLVVDVKKPLAFRVPTAKSRTSPPQPPLNSGVDHFTCYKVHVTRGTPPFLRISGVTLEDQFGSLTVDVIKARRLCAPTDKNNEEPGAETHADHLMCYLIRQTSLPKFAAVSPIFIDNQFGPLTLDARKPVELCVPASKNSSAGPTATLTPLGPTPTAATATPTATPSPTTTLTPIPGATLTVTPTPMVTATPQPCPDLSNVPCPTSVQSDTDGVGVDLDTGWTGLAHDADAPSMGRLTLAVGGCSGGPNHPCGQCTLSGPIANAGGTPFNNQRCVGDTAVQCTSDADCTNAGVAGPCHFFFGGPLPLSAGGVSTCVTNEITTAVTGTADIEAGTNATALTLHSRVHTGFTQDQPCPNCIAGACAAGPRAGMACTVNGSSPLFGDVSFDCPPNPGAVVGDLLIALDLRTGTQTRTLTAASPNCTGPGFGSRKCFCATCNNTNAEACASNADCPDPPGPVGPVCGGKRCNGGSNTGVPCSGASECPSGSCSSDAPNARQTQPNQCDDATCSANTPPDGDSCNEGVCAVGPFDQSCAIETFRGCNSNGDCPKPGDSCTGGKFRECFTDNGTVGNDVSVCGQADPRCGNTAHPKVGALFCIPPTNSPSVNGAAGLPGLGRVGIPVTSFFAPVVATATPGPGVTLTPTSTLTTTPHPGTATPTRTRTPTPTPTATATTGTCGNGTVDPGEQCDPTAPGVCPSTSPNAGKACTGPTDTSCLPGLCPTQVAACHPSQCVPPGASPGDTFACTCATGQFRGFTTANGLSDNGWTGGNIGAASNTGDDIDLLLFDCDNMSDPLCRLAGPRVGPHGKRCEFDFSVHCITDADCVPLNGRCVFTNGAPLPLVPGGVPVCVTLFWQDGITGGRPVEHGTVNVSTGEWEIFRNLVARVHGGISLDSPCPLCNCTVPGCTNQIGDAGTCSNGPNVTRPCTIDGKSDAFGPSSRDCPPSNAANVSGNGLDLPFQPSTTGQSTLDAEVPCTAPGFTQFKCACDTCGGGPTPGAPCKNDAQCGAGGICGRARCQGGPNDGQLCPPAVCGTGNACGHPGTLTQPNSCNLACTNSPTTSCATDGDCPSSLPGSCVPLCLQIPGELTGEGQCALGPTVGLCSTQTFRSCNADAQCNATTCLPPGTCTNCGTLCNQTCVVSNKLCHVFPIVTQGQPSAFAGNIASGIVNANTFCIPPTSSPAVNSAAGLPGEGVTVSTQTWIKKFPPDSCGSACP